MRFPFSRRVRLAALVVVVLGLAAGGIAYANIPDSTGVIHSCYRKTSPSQGTLRVIDTEKGQTCASGENPLDWNQHGPPGPPGPPAVILGDTTNNGGHDINGCTDTDVAEIGFTVASPTRIYISAGGMYQRAGTNLTLGEITTKLYDGGGNVVATSWVAATDTPTGDIGQFLGITGVLRQGSDPSAPAFVAATGSYQLRLIASAFNGDCSAQPKLNAITLTYLLLGA